MKKISYSTTMALLLACSALTTSVVASARSNQQQGSDITDEIQKDAGNRAATSLVQTSVASSNQSAPTVGEMASGVTNKLVSIPGIIVQGLLERAGVQSFIRYDQPLSAFEIAAAERIILADAKAKLDHAKEETGVEILVSALKSAVDSKDERCKSKDENRCKTIRAYDAAIEQRNQNDLEFLRTNFAKIYNTPEKIEAYINGINPAILRELQSRQYFANIKEQDTNELLKQIVVVPRGLGLQPGMHAMIKGGYHYSVFAGSSLCKLPTDYDLRYSSKVTGDNFPKILNQGGTEACVAHAFSSALNFARRAQGLTDGRVPSRQFIWSWTRQIGNSGQPFDGKLHKGLGNWGCNMGIAGDLVSAQGAPSESDIGSEWYGDMGWHAGTSNSATSYDSNLLSLLGHAETDVASPLVFIHQSDTNTRDLNALAIKCALHNGYPVLAAIDVRRSSYYNAAANSSGDWVTPFSDNTVNNSIDFEHPVGEDADHNPIYAAGDFSVGGHAILICGYNDKATNSDGTPDGKFTFMNSWGTWWGKDGFGTLPYEYVCGTSTSYKAPTGENAILANISDNHGGKVYNIANTMFSNAPYAGFFAQIKSCTK
mgnify:CR=1 FL=1